MPSLGMASPEEMEPYLEEMSCNYHYLQTDPVNHFFFLIPVEKGSLTAVVIKGASTIVPLLKTLLYMCALGAAICYPSEIIY